MFSHSLGEFLSNYEHQPLSVMFERSALEFSQTNFETYATTVAVLALRILHLSLEIRAEVFLKSIMSNVFFAKIYR